MIKNKKIENLNYIRKLSSKEVLDVAVTLEKKCKKFKGPVEDVNTLQNKIKVVIGCLPGKITKENGLKDWMNRLECSLQLLENWREKNKLLSDDVKNVETETYRKVDEIGKRILYHFKNIRLQPPREKREVDMCETLIMRCISDLDQIKIHDEDKQALECRENHLILCTDILEKLHKQSDHQHTQRQQSLTDMRYSSSHSSNGQIFSNINYSDERLAPQSPYFNKSYWPQGHHMIPPYPLMNNPFIPMHGMQHPSRYNFPLNAPPPFFRPNLIGEPLIQSNIQHPLMSLPPNLVRASVEEMTEKLASILPLETSVDMKKPAIMDDPKPTEITSEAETHEDNNAENNTENNNTQQESETGLSDTEVFTDLCEQLIKECMSFWGPIPRLPVLQRMVSKLIDEIPQRFEIESPVQLLVSELKNCQKLLENRASMIESAADLESSSDDDDDFDSNLDENTNSISNLDKLFVSCTNLLSMDDEEQNTSKPDDETSETTSENSELQELSVSDIKTKPAGVTGDEGLIAGEEQIEQTDSGVDDVTDSTKNEKTQQENQELVSSILQPTTQELKFNAGSFTSSPDAELNVGAEQAVPLIPQIKREKLEEILSFTPQETMEGVNKELKKIFTWMAIINGKLDALIATSDHKLDRQALLDLRHSLLSTTRLENLPKLEVMTRQSQNYSDRDLEHMQMPKYLGCYDRPTPQKLCDPNLRLL